MAEYLRYKRGRCEFVSAILHWGAFPIPVQSRGGLLSASGGNQEVGIGLSAYAIVAERATDGDDPDEEMSDFYNPPAHQTEIFRPVVIPLDGSVTVET